MRYLAAIGMGALLIGLLLSLGVFYVFGRDPGYFFAKFIAGPVGLIVSGVLFIVYDSVWPNKK